MSKRKSLMYVHLTDLITKLEDYKANIERFMRQIEDQACQESGYSVYDTVLNYIGTLDGLKKNYINGSVSERYNFHALHACPTLKALNGLIASHKEYTSELEGVKRKITSAKETLEMLGVKDE